MNATSNFSDKIRDIYSIESISSGKTCIHRLHPAAKIVSTFIFLAVVVSFGRYEFARLTPYLFYPVLVMALAEIPYPLMLRRFSLALPFCLFAGAPNIFFDRGTALLAGGFPVSFGLLSLFAILFRGYLCVTAVLILVAVTPFTQLTAQLERMRVPGVFITLFEVTYRYLGTLLEEASSMYAAYILRSGRSAGLEMRHMGSFAGQLLLRSIDRAERVFRAMKCRGFAAGRFTRKGNPLALPDYIFLSLVCLPSLAFRFTDVPSLLGGWIGRLF